jgi:hypothetical protein
MTQPSPAVATRMDFVTRKGLVHFTIRASVCSSTASHFIGGYCDQASVALCCMQQRCTALSGRTAVRAMTYTPGHPVTARAGGTAAQAQPQPKPQPQQQVPKGTKVCHVPDCELVVHATPVLTVQATMHVLEGCALYSGRWVACTSPATSASVPVHL